MSEFEWLCKATVFSLGNCKHYKRPVEIVAREQRDGSVKWSVKMHEWCLGKDGEWHIERIPSSRTDEFLGNCRFETKEIAYLHWITTVTKEMPLYV